MFFNIILSICSNFLEVLSMYWYYMGRKVNVMLKALGSGQKSYTAATYINIITL
jgi:hypothetical protein